jgi:hypothetical protein
MTARRGGREGGLQSGEGAPKINAFMKFVGETRTISKPGAARWALLFVGASYETSGAEAHEGVAALMSHLKVRPTKRGNLSTPAAKAGSYCRAVSARFPSTALRTSKPCPDETPFMRFIQGKSSTKRVQGKPFDRAQMSHLKVRATKHDRKEVFTSAAKAVHVRAPGAARLKSCPDETTSSSGIRAGVEAGKPIDFAQGKPFDCLRSKSFTNCVQDKETQ